MNWAVIAEPSTGGQPMGLTASGFQLAGPGHTLLQFATLKEAFDAAVAAVAADTTHTFVRVGASQQKTH